jgi:hypothetical protein
MGCRVSLGGARLGARPAPSRRVRPRPVDKVLALTIPERETIISALDDPPPGLEELRCVLLSQHTWRQRQGASCFALRALTTVVRAVTIPRNHGQRGVRLAGRDRGQTCGDCCVLSALR